MANDKGWLARSNREVLEWGKRHIEYREQLIRDRLFPNVTPRPMPPPPTATRTAAPDAAASRDDARCAPDAAEELR